MLKFNKSLDGQFNLTIRSGCNADIPGLVRLNQLWYKSNLSSYENGFLSIAYDRAFFKAIIKNNDLLLFESYDNLIKGYVLVNTVIITDHIKHLREQYLQLKPEQQKRKIAFSCQLCLDKELQGCGFIDVIQGIYADFFKTKYDFLVSTIDNENIRSIKAHAKTGWKLYESDKNMIAELVL